ncbi:MAG: hypothetical protein CML20_03800 [Rheinheimera sp.]|nr:hypothetical protein [Rheinheimera sp.]|tara:strand:- start:2853 stop:3689 length:837 start_codon:yes stop_codon:yes gene_type:complete
MKLNNLVILGLLFICCCFNNAQAAETSTKCPAGPALANAAPTGGGDSVYYADHYCIMAKRPGKGQIAKLISSEQANGVTSRYDFVFKTLQTDQERVAFIDEFIQRFSRVAWLTVARTPEGFSDLTITAQRTASDSDTKNRHYHLRINLFKGMHEVLLPRLDNFVVNERASVEVPQHTSALVHYVITGIRVAQWDDTQPPQWEDNVEYEEWAEEHADETCETINRDENAKCKYDWISDNDTGEKWITFEDRVNGFWTGYTYYRHLLQIPPSNPPVFMPY